MENFIYQDPEELLINTLKARDCIAYADEPAQDNVDYIVPRRLQDVGYNVTVEVFDIPQYPGHPFFRVTWGDIRAMTAYGCVIADDEFRKATRDIVMGRPGNYSAKFSKILDRLHPLTTENPL